jgi:hypothetical protein
MVVDLWLLSSFNYYKANPSIMYYGFHNAGITKVTCVLSYSGTFTHICLSSKDDSGYISSCLLTNLTWQDNYIDTLIIPGYIMWHSRLRIYIPEGSYHTGYIMWHFRLRIYIPVGCASGNIEPKPEMSHYIPCLIAD